MPEIGDNNLLNGRRTLAVQFSIFKPKKPILLWQTVNR